MGECLSKGTLECSPTGLACKTVAESTTSDFGFATPTNGGDLNCDGQIEYAPQVRAKDPSGKQFDFPPCSSNIAAAISSHNGDVSLLTQAECTTCFYERDRKCSTSETDYIDVVNIIWSTGKCIQWWLQTGIQLCR